MGRSADPSLLQKLTFIAMHFDERILQVDTVRAFSVGESLLCELCCGGGIATRFPVSKIGLLVYVCVHAYV
mgnify:CR=1 FL=1